MSFPGKIAIQSPRVSILVHGVFDTAIARESWFETDDLSTLITSTAIDGDVAPPIFFAAADPRNDTGISVQYFLPGTLADLQFSGTLLLADASAFPKDRRTIAAKIDGLDFMASTGRVIVSGTTSIAPGATASLATFTRNTNERVSFAGFGVDDILGVQFTQGGSIPGASGINYWFERTANSNEITAKAKNNDATVPRSLDWLIFGIVP